MPGEAVVLALDLGTSCAKGALYTRSGEQVSLASRDYPVARPAPGFVEQRPEDYVEAARDIVRRLLQTAYPVAAVGFSTQTPTLVFCDAAGRPVFPAILWQDSRAGEEARWLLEHADDSARRQWFGLDLPIGAATAPAKLLWMPRHVPEIWRSVRWVMQPKDFVAAQLTGRFTTDHWCAKGLAHFPSGAVRPEWLELIGKAESPCPEVLYPHAVNGVVTGDAAEAWGLRAGTIVTVGWSDALAGILAAGALHEEGRGFVLSGTSEIVGVSRTGGPQAAGLFLTPPEVLPLRNLELHYGPTQAGGSCLEWAAALFSMDVEQALAALPAGLCDIVFRPYLEGERAPFWDHTLRAGFDGLRTSHRMPDLVHAVLQGVALHERLVLECAGCAPGAAVVLAGGAARHRGWNQLRADILQRRILVMLDAEASLRGAALLAWSAAGAIDLAQPPDTWLAGCEILPDLSCASKSEELYQRFCLNR